MGGARAEHETARGGPGGRLPQREARPRQARPPHPLLNLAPLRGDADRPRPARDTAARGLHRAGGISAFEEALKHNINLNPKTLKQHKPKP
eukprot:1183168-Prorocentrum_minimum.AAC.2